MVFTENENTYTLQTDEDGELPLYSGLWLALIGADEVPPHIALVYEGRYYSVSVKRTDAGSPAGSLLQALGRRSKPSLFVKIKLPPAFTEKNIAAFFEKYPPLKPVPENSGNAPVTCLNPVRDFFARVYSEKYKQASFVFELLALAQKDGIIERCAGIHLARKPEIVLAKYTNREITEKINSITATASD